MNIEENIDYIFLNILKYYQKSNLDAIVINFDNTPNDRLLFEIIRENIEKFNLIYIQCDLDKYEKLFSEILSIEEKEKITFRDLKSYIKNNGKIDYIISSKNKLYCKSFLKFDYDENDLYPLFNYSNEEILKLLSKYNIKIDELNKEQYGLENNKIEILNNYYYNYEKFMESSKEDVQFILTFVHKQNMLKTKIIPSLNDMKNMEKYI